MQREASKITYGAMMVALFTVLASITFYVPLIGTFTLFFLPLPLLLYRMRYDRVSTVLVGVVSLLVSFVFGGIFILPLTLTFIIIGIVMGDTIRQEQTKFYTFMATGLAILLTMVTTYVATVFLFGINVIEELMTSLRGMQTQIMSTMVQLGEVPETFEQQLESMMTFYEVAIPSIFILSAFTFAYLLVVVNTAILNRFGHKVPTFGSFRSMKLPTVTVWVYLLIIILPFLGTIERGSMSELIYINGQTILRVLFLLQGISFIVFYMTASKLPKWVTVVTVLLAIMLSPITTLIGILDTGMNLRAWMTRKK